MEAISLFPSPYLNDLLDINISGLRSLRIFFLNTLIDFIPENNNTCRGLYTQPDLLATNLEDRNANVISDEKPFAGFSG